MSRIFDELAGVSWFVGGVVRISIWIYGIVMALLVITIVRSIFYMIIDCWRSLLGPRRKEPLWHRLCVKMLALLVLHNCDVIKRLENKRRCRDVRVD